MNRRTVLVLGSSALTAALAGCVSNSVDVDFDDPGAVVEAFIIALIEPDFAIMEAALHDEGHHYTPVDGSRQDKHVWADSVTPYERRVLSTTVIEEESPERVVVEADIIDEYHGSGTRGTVSYVLQSEGGNWHIYTKRRDSFEGIVGPL